MNNMFDDRAIMDGLLYCTDKDGAFCERCSFSVQGPSCKKILNKLAIRRISELKKENEKLKK